MQELANHSAVGIDPEALDSTILTSSHLSRTSIMTESKLRQRHVPKAKLTTEDVVQAQISDSGKTFGTA